ncbi:MAG: YqgE/AlgH family protein [Pseudonocardiales bacterium]|nr:YqgE/AlgH family protein [Actinomycetota bacterium]PZS11852.1 MAG: YqgE/AlgH family protein [Pseudonocardiales bacterium]
MSDVAAVSSLERGSALVAAPWLHDPNFHRTVVLIIDHGASGSLGVVLNRPSNVAVRDVLPSWGPHATLSQALYVGGPVQRRAALCVAALPAGLDAERTAGMIKVRGSLALIDLEADPELLAPQLRGLRVFAGYAGWGEGQLAGEIRRGDWVVVPALVDDVLAPPETDLWSQILRRQGMPLALLATYPPDPTQN